MLKALTQFNVTEARFLSRCEANLLKVCEEEEEEIGISAFSSSASVIDRRWYKQRTIALAVINRRRSSGNKISGHPGNRQNWQIDARVVVSNYIFIFFHRLRNISVPSSVDAHLLLLLLLLPPDVLQRRH